MPDAHQKRAVTLLKAVRAREAVERAIQNMPTNPYEGWTRAQLISKREEAIEWSRRTGKEDSLSLAWVEHRRAAIAEGEGDRFSATVRLGDAIAYFRRAAKTSEEAAKALDAAKAQFAQLA
ncbi:MAG: hypothetical protein CMF11_02230 [Idiomarina sp.]|nr:hypothetical protein [Idiomarina sp.]